MRAYGIVSPKFWTGTTGKAIRVAGRDVQVVALYLMTAPSANMIGLYYLPLPMLRHETGIPLQGASKALRSLHEVDFAHYDDLTEHVWVPEMARFQIGESMKPGDKRIAGVVRELLSVKSCRFARDFHAKYQQRFHLPGLDRLGLAPSTSEAPSESLRSQEQDQEQGREEALSSSARRPDPLHHRNGRNGTREPAAAVLEYLNVRAGRSYRATDANSRPTASLALIEDRLKSGVSVDDCKAVIDAKGREWGGDPKMKQFLRPKTLFNATNFENYLGEVKARPSNGLDEGGGARFLNSDLDPARGRV